MIAALILAATITSEVGIFYTIPEWMPKKVPSEYCFGAKDDYPRRITTNTAASVIATYDGYAQRMHAFTCTETNAHELAKCSVGGIYPTEEAQRTLVSRRLIEPKDTYGYTYWDELANKNGPGLIMDADTMFWATAAYGPADYPTFSWTKNPMDKLSGKKWPAPLVNWSMEDMWDWGTMSEEAWKSPRMYMETMNNVIGDEFETEEFNADAPDEEIGEWAQEFYGVYFVDDLDNPTRRLRIGRYGLANQVEALMDRTYEGNLRFEADFKKVNIDYQIATWIDASLDKDKFEIGITNQVAFLSETTYLSDMSWEPVSNRVEQTITTNIVKTTPYYKTGGTHTGFGISDIVLPKWSVWLTKENYDDICSYINAHESTRFPQQMKVYLDWEDDEPVAMIACNDGYYPKKLSMIYEEKGLSTTAMMTRGYSGEQALDVKEVYAPAMRPCEAMKKYTSGKLYGMLGEYDWDEDDTSNRVYAVGVYAWGESTEPKDAAKSAWKDVATKLEERLGCSLLESDKYCPVSKDYLKYLTSASKIGTGKVRLIRNNMEQYAETNYMVKVRGSGMPGIWFHSNKKLDEWGESETKESLGLTYGWLDDMSGYETTILSFDADSSIYAVYLKDKYEYNKNGGMYNIGKVKRICERYDESGNVEELDPKIEETEDIEWHEREKPHVIGHYVDDQQVDHFTWDGESFGSNDKEMGAMEITFAIDYGTNKVYKVAERPAAEGYGGMRAVNRVDWKFPSMRRN